MINGARRWLDERLWRRRLARIVTQCDQWTAEFMEWQRDHPDRCLYCSYTRWATDAQGQKRQTFKLDPHNCVEGNSQPHPLPRARAIA
jgi:hypothetical protein